MFRVPTLIGSILGLAAFCGSASQPAEAGPAFLARADVRPVAGPGVRGTSDDRATDGVLVLFERGDGLDLPVNAQMSLGVNYEYLTEEDLLFEVAETGSLVSGYDDHRVMVRASWRF